MRGDWRERLLVGYVSEEPFSYRDREGRLTGFDVEILEAFRRHERIGALDWHEVLWGDLERHLGSGLLHLAVTGLAWNEARAAVGEPTEPLYTVTSMAFVPKGNPERILSVDDMVGRPYRAGAIPGGLEYRVLAERLGARAVGYPDEDALWSALDRGDIAVGVFAEHAGLSYLKHHPEARFERADGFVFPILPKTMYFAAKGEAGLKSALDAFIRAIKRDGTLEDILVRFDYPVDSIVAAGASPY